MYEYKYVAAPATKRKVDELLTEMASAGWRLVAVDIGHMYWERRHSWS